MHPIHSVREALTGMEPVGVSAVEKELEFIRFLLTATKVQATLLLRHLTHQQTNAISEIFLNLLVSTSIEPELISGLRKHKLLLRRVGDRKKGVLTRRRDIAKHAGIVLRILYQVESVLPQA